MGVRFARTVKRALAVLRERGLTDKQIEELTGISFGTFHRWARGDLGKHGPQPTKVRQFFERAGMSAKQAFDDLGWSDDPRPVATPEPEMEPDFRETMRKLRDPNVSDAEKFHIRATMAALAARPKSPTGAARKS